MDAEIRTLLEQMRDWRWRGDPHSALHPLASALLQLDQQMTEMRDQHRHLVKSPELLEPVWTGWSPELTAKTETPPSSPDTTQQEDDQSGGNTSSATYSLAKVVQPGGEPITVTVTFRGSNSPGTRGGVLRLLQENHWTLLDPSMLEKQLATGPTPPSPQSSGQPAGIEAGGEMPLFTDDTGPVYAVGPEGRFAEEEQG